MNVCGSLFSGVGGMDLGLARAGWDHAFFCEADPYRRRVLARHWPGVPIYEDVREIGPDAPRVDLLCGGFPCQPFSVAGNAAGLIDGEGCVYIDKGYTVRIDVGMTERAKPTLDGLCSRYGGTVRLYREETDRWQAAWTWTIIGTAASECLSKLLPHLRIKHEQARLALAVQALREEMPLNKYKRRCWSPELKERAETMRIRLMELNRKGPLKEEWPAGTFARLVGGQWVTPQLDMFSDLGHETFSGPWPSSGLMRDGACSIVATSECPRDGDGSSSLADVLVGDVPERFFLSPRAAAGILRRAERRGRELPRHLAEALAALASAHRGGGRRTTTTSSPLFRPARDEPETRAQKPQRETSSSPTPSVPRASTPQRTEQAEEPRSSQVRRLTPTECERLQSLPDGWTVPDGRSLLSASTPSSPTRKTPSTTRQDRSPESSARPRREAA